jgi:hypothetical protein
LLRNVTQDFGIGDILWWALVNTVINLRFHKREGISY